MESIRQMAVEVGYHNHLIVHVTLVPYIQASEELKTKPTQHSVMKLREIGLSPDIIMCRSSYSLSDSVAEKIALFCNVPKDHVIEGKEVKSIYEVPLVLDKQKMGHRRIAQSGKSFSKISATRRAFYIRIRFTRRRK